jgi:hypothetical protein
MKRRKHFIINTSLFLLFLEHVQGFGSHCHGTNKIDRKQFLTSMLGGMIISPLSSVAKNTQPSTQEDIAIIREAASTLSILLDNWERATVECNFADVPRELLEQKNKELLLEKASTFALFDKSTSVVSCKKSNRLVRDYIGVTGKGPLVNIEKRMLRRGLVDMLDPDDLEEYYSMVENFQQSIARAAAASYTAGIADLDSVNNFEKGSQSFNDESNLDQARRDIEDARKSMDGILNMIGKVG